MLPQQFQTLYSKNRQNYNNVKHSSITSIPPKLKTPLALKGSLIKYIERQSKSSVTVQVIHQGWRPLLLNERRSLKLSRKQHAWVREVTLSVHGHPCIYAISIIPLRALKGKWKRLQRLDTQPLGQQLHPKPSIQRQILSTTLLHPTSSHPETTWRRLSSFSYKQRPHKQLLLFEYFLNHFTTSF
jgi:chorismate lyase